MATIHSSNRVNRLLFTVLWTSLFTFGIPISTFSQSEDFAPQALDSNSDIFEEGAFDNAVEMGTKAAEKNKLEWLGGLTLVSNTNLLLLPEQPSAGASQRLFGKAFLKASAGDLGAVLVSYAYSHLLLAGGSSAGLRSYYDAIGGQEPDLGSPSFSLSELHYSFDLEKVLFIRLGNQLLGWSASRIWSPADFVNQVTADSAAPIDVRSGKSGLRLHFPLPGANVFAFADFSQTVKSVLPNGPKQTTNVFETVNYAVRADATLGGFNVGVQAYAGWYSPFRLGATVSGNLFGLDLWGEFGSTVPVNGYGGDWAFSVGGEKTFGDDKEWAIRTEYFHQSSGNTDTDLSLLLSALPIPALYWGKDYVWLEFSNTKLAGTALGASIAGTLNISDLSFKVKGKLDFNLSRLVPFSFALSYQGGPENREFTSIGTGPGTVHGKQYLVGELTAILNL